MTTQFSERITLGGSGVGALELGLGLPLVLFCGPCVIESREQTLRHAEKIVGLSQKFRSGFVFKSSYDKANRTSVEGFRGPGIDAGLEILAEVRREFGIGVLTDIHSPEEAEKAGEVVDLIQVPAFLCRQTDLLVAAGKTGKPVMVKKGQFLAPEDMRFAAEKVASSGNANVLFCERGSCFGYRNLVVDFKGLQLMGEIGCPVVFDATHSVQVMGGAGGASGGAREFIPALARAAVAVGVAGVFLESHEEPEKAKSDGPNMLPLSELEPLLGDLEMIHQLELNGRY